STENNREIPLLQLSGPSRAGCATREPMSARCRSVPTRNTSEVANPGARVSRGRSVITPNAAVMAAYAMAMARLTFAHRCARESRSPARYCSRCPAPARSAAGSTFPRYGSESIWLEPLEDEPGVEAEHVQQ